VGSKWSLKAYKKKLKELGIDSKKLFKDINDVIIKACISVEQQCYNSVSR
jgi:hypothetical protein